MVSREAGVESFPIVFGPVFGPTPGQAAVVEVDCAGHLWLVGVEAFQIVVRVVWSSFLVQLPRKCGLSFRI